MKISVCIPATRLSTVGDAIASVRRQQWSDWELLVVTQCASPELADLVDRAAASDPGIRHIALNHRGLSVARNAGVLGGTGEIIAMMDDDAEAQADWLSTLASCFQADAEIGLVGGAVLPPPQATAGNCPVNFPREVIYRPSPGGRPPDGWDWIGCNFAFRKELVAQVGLFDPLLGAGAPFPSCDDTDYKMRIEALGVPMLVTPRSVMYHTHGTRKGLQARLRHQRNYSLGNGAMAGKLTLLGDAKGLEWLQATRKECLYARPAREGLHRAPSEWRRLAYFIRGYKAILRDYTVDADGLLAARATEPVELVTR